MAESVLRDSSGFSIRDAIQREQERRGGVHEKATPEEANNKATLVTGALGNEAIEGTQERVKNEILETNTSPMLEEVKQRGHNRKTLATEQVIQDVVLDPQISITDKPSLIEQAAAIDADVSLNEEFEHTTSTQASTPTKNSQELQENIIVPDLFREIQARELTFDPDDAIQDVVLSVALPGFGIQLVEVISQAMPGLASPGDEALPGSLVNKFKEERVLMSPDAQEDVVRRVAKAVENNTFWGTDNGAIKRELMLTLLGDLKPSTADELALNIISILDYLALGEAFRIGSAGVKAIAKGAKGAKAGGLANKILNNPYFRKRRGSPGAKLDQTDTQQAKEVANDVLEDRLDAITMGGTKESYTQEHVLPDPNELPSTNAVDLNESFETVLNYDARGIAWNDIEKLGTANRAFTRAAAIKSVAPTVHINKTQLEEIEGGLRARTYIGLSDGGFSSQSKARSIEKDLRNEFPIDLYVVDGRTNEIRPFNDVPKEHRMKEYYLAFEEELRYGTDEAIGINPIRPDGVTGLAAKYFTKSSFLLDEFAGAGSVLGDSKAARARTLSDLFKPVTDLRSGQRHLVEDIIDRGDQIGKFFTDAELSLEWGSRQDFDKLLGAYHAFQRFQQAQWKLVNDGIRTRLDGENWKEVVIPVFGLDGKMLGRPLHGRDLPASVQTVYDPVADTIRPLTPEELTNIQASKIGGEADITRDFVQVRTAIQKDQTATFYVSLVGVSQDALQINRLPDEVIKNIPGRIPRLYDATHIVKKRVTTFIDGEKIEGGIPIRIAANSGDARRMADELDFSDPDFDPNTFSDVNRKYFVEEASELRQDKDYANGTSVDYYQDTGQLWISERGIELDGIDGKRPIRPVLDRVEAAREKASRIGTLDSLVEKWVKNWEREFGAEFGVEGRFPGFGEQLVRPRRITTDRGITSRRFKDATAFRDHIMLVSGANEGMLQRSVRNWAVDLADTLATPKGATTMDKARNVFASQLLKARNVDPVNMMKQGAFIQFIIGNPIRQLALQSQQASLYMTEPGALRYFTSGEGIRDWSALNTGLLTRDHPAVWKAHAAKASKAMGMSVDEYTEFVDAFRKTGLYQNIDSHAFSAGMLTDKTFGGSGGFISDTAFASANKAIQTAKMIRKLGFDAGEKTHLSVGFLAARNAWLKANPKKAHLWAQGENLAEITARTRAISFEMTREGAVQFQKGLMGLIFQFASHNFKAIQALLPQTRLFGMGKLSNKAFSNKQKAAIALTQLGTYGVGGFGVYEAYDTFKANFGQLFGEEIPEEVDSIIKEGLAGSLIQALVAGATNDPFDVDASGNIGTFSGIFEVPMFRTMADAAAIGAFRIENIPFASTAESVGQAVETISFLTGGADFERLGMNPADRALLAFDEILRLAPIYNKTMKARAELAIGRLISNQGVASVDASPAEILAKALIGVQPTAERQVFDLTAELRGKRFTENLTDPINQGLRDHAARIYLQARKILQRTGDNEATVTEVYQFARAAAAVDRELLSDHEYRLVHNKYLPQLMYTDLRKGTPDAELIKLLESRLDNGELETIDTVIEKIGQSDVLRNQEAVAEFLRNLGE